MPPADNTTDVAQAVEAWAADVTEFNSYEHAPKSLGEALPVVIAEVQSDRVVKADSDLKFSGYQQLFMRIWEVELMLLTEPGTNPDETWAASQNLYAAVDALGASLVEDPTLSERVESATPTYRASYDPPELEHTDGTVARVATVIVNIGKTIGGN